LKFFLDKPKVSVTPSVKKKGEITYDELNNQYRQSRPLSNDCFVTYTYYQMLKHERPDLKIKNIEKIEGLGVDQKFEDQYINQML
jgi:hypothetical protein